MTRTNFRTILLPVALLTVFAACGKKDEPAANDIPVPAPAAPAAIRVTELETGKAISTDKQVMNGMDSFGVRDTIFLSVKTEGTSAGSKLTAKWTYNETQVVNETTESIAPSGTAYTEFHISKPSGWPKGKYKVVVTLDGVESGSREFVVQ